MHIRVRVATIMFQGAARCSYNCRPINDRMITGRFYSRLIKTTIIQVYAPTNEAEEEGKDNFYEQLQKIVNATRRHDMLLILDDWNAKVGQQQVGEEGFVENYGLQGERNDNSEQVVAFCTLNNLTIVSTTFPHKDIHRYTWTSPNGQYRNQIDRLIVAIRSNFKRSVQDVRAYRGADVVSHYNLVIAKTLLKRNRTGRKVHVVKSYDTSKLNMPETRKKFQLGLRNRFSCLSIDDDDDEEEEEEEEGSGQESMVVLESKVEIKWTGIKNAFCETAKEVLGYRTKRGKSWISSDSWKGIEESRQLRRRVLGAKSEGIRARFQKYYRKKDQEVKKSLMRDKREWANGITQEAENAAKLGQKKVFTMPHGSFVMNHQRKLI